MPNGKFDEAEIRKIVMAEVASQLKPFGDKIDAMHDWQLGFWSNGSGRPVGFFQRRMKEDDERNIRVITYIDNAEKRQAESETRKKVEEERQQAREAAWRKWSPVVKWVGGILSTLVIAAAVWLGSKVVLVAEILWQDYEHNHPGVSQQLKTIGAQPDPAYAKKQIPPEDAAVHAH
jgi:hypothetical protein